MPRAHGRPTVAARTKVTAKDEAALKDAPGYVPTTLPTPPADTTPASAPTITPLVRKVGWRWRSDDGTFGVLHIKNGETEFNYFATRVGGALWTLTKMVPGAPVTYTCVVASDEKTRRCGCDGWRFNEHCKHMEAMLSLRTQGKL